MRAVFVNVRGQDDNLGDSGLRRGLLQGARSDAYTLHVNAGGQSDGYLSGLGLSGADVVYRDSEKWYRALRRAAPRGAGVLFNAGERNPSGNAPIFSATEYAAIAAARLHRVGAALTGVGLRTTTALPFANRIALRALDIVAWRDPLSRNTASIGEVQPDWAFALGEAVLPATTRDRLVLVLRGDRTRLSDAQLDTVRRVIAVRELTPTVAVQVRGDSAYARELVDALGAELVDWRGDDHATHEALLRTLYRETRYLMSDRLHALVYGFTEGAAPIAFAAGPVEKAERTFAAVGVEAIGLGGVAISTSALERLLGGIDRRANEFEERRLAARVALKRRSIELQSLFSR